MARKIDLLQGTLDLLILPMRSRRECPARARRRTSPSEGITQGAFRVKPGSLFSRAPPPRGIPGWLSSEWGESENNRRAKFYNLTKAGRRQLDIETESWRTISLAITRAIDATS